MTAIKEPDAKTHPVKHVTIFKSGRAEVVRSFSVELQAGENKLEITHLSNLTVKESIRVSGIGGAARLASLVSSIPSAYHLTHSSFPSPTSLASALEKKYKYLIAQQSFLVEEKDILERYARSLTGKDMPGEEMLKWMDAWRARQRKTLEEVYAWEEPIREVLEEAGEEKRGRKGRGPQAEGKVSVRIVAQEATTVDLRVRYVVDNARWEPIYDLHASTTHPHSTTTSVVKLHYRALVSQSTGEDWTGARLTLNTSDALTRRVPAVPTFKIVSALFGKPVDGPGPFAHHPAPSTPLFGGGGGGSSGSQSHAVQPFGGPAAFAAGVPFGGTAAGAESSANSAGPGFGAQTSPAFQPAWAGGGGATNATYPLSEGAATIRKSNIFESYLVQGTVKIPSDGREHTVSIAEFEFEADIARLAVPCVTADVYLQCKVKNSSEHRLLAGDVSVFLDDGFVSTASIPDVAVNETFECALGVDPLFGIVYTRIPTLDVTTPTIRLYSDSEQFVRTYTARTTVKNKRDTAVRGIVLRDALPQGDPPRDCKVVLRKPQGLAEAREGEVVDVDVDVAQGTCKVRWSELPHARTGEKEGKFEWVVDLGPAEEIVLVAEWDVKAPKNMAWIEAAES